MLKGQAHKLEPVVLIGAKGLTDEVVAEIALALKAHELIKVRAPGHDRKERAGIFREIPARTGSALISVESPFLLGPAPTNMATGPSS